MDFTVKLVEVGELLNPVKVEVRMLKDRIPVKGDEFLHIRYIVLRVRSTTTQVGVKGKFDVLLTSHDSLIYVFSKKRPLQGLVADLQVKRVPDRDGSFQRALAALLAHILR